MPEATLPGCAIFNANYSIDWVRYVGKTMEFSSSKLQEILKTFGPVQRFCIAYSGGLDSQVLLYAAQELRSRFTAALAAVHVDHGLHPQSRDWARRCGEVCDQFGVPLTVITVDAAAGTGQSPEAAARDARYLALADWLSEGDCLLTAHHQDDQAETVLLQMLRGGGVRGLAAMPVVSSLGRARLGRPLLSFTRAQLLDYAKCCGLDWLEDPSNQACRLDRNRLRHEIVPALRKRWPSVSTTLARVAENQADAAYLLDQLARSDLAQISGLIADTLPITPLVNLDSRRRHNLLRYWLRQRGFPIPSRAVLHRLDQDLLQARWDGTPCLAWAGCEVRRYRNLLYALQPLPQHNRDQHISWESSQPLQLASAGGVLRAEPARGEGLRPQYCKTALAIRFRHGGERCRPAGRHHHHRLKHLFQERGIPPWERDRMPLIYVNGRLAAIADLWVCEPFQAGPNETGVRIRWQRAGKTAVGPP